MINVKSFNTAEGAFEALKLVEAELPQLLNEFGSWNTYKVIHDEPQVWRLWRQLGELRICFHKIYPCIDPFLHPHPWPSVVKCLKGGYEHTVAISNNSRLELHQLQPDSIDNYTSGLIKQTSIVVPGSVYEMTDIRHFHSVKAHEINWSLMLMGKPYFDGATRQFSRKKPADSQLSMAEKTELYNFACMKYE